MKRIISSAMLLALIGIGFVNFSHAETQTVSERAGGCVIPLGGCRPTGR